MRCERGGDEGKGMGLGLVVVKVFEIVGIIYWWWKVIGQNEWLLSLIVIVIGYKYKPEM